MNKTMNGPTELWAMRKHFTSQLAAASFMTHMFAVPQRFPSRLTVSRETGKIVVHEIIPGGAAPIGTLAESTDTPAGMAGVAPVYNAGESVPFRFTPNMQRFVGPIFTEGILTTGIMAIGRALTDPEVSIPRPELRTSAKPPSRTSSSSSCASFRATRSTHG
jgi:transformation/transcription domain-associated protein